MVIEIGDWRIARYDSRNWGLAQRGIGRDGEPMWARPKRFHQTIGDALEDVYEHELMDGGDDVVSLSEAIAECRRLSEYIRNAVRACSDVH